MSSDENEMVLVSKAELEELRKLKEDLPAIIEKAKAEEAKDALHRLHQRDKENPEGHRERSKKHYELKKDEILAKRREAYKAKKAAKLEVSSAIAEKSPGPL